MVDVEIAVVAAAQVRAVLNIDVEAGPDYLHAFDAKVAELQVVAVDVVEDDADEDHASVLVGLDHFLFGLTVSHPGFCPLHSEFIPPLPVSQDSLTLDLPLFHPFFFCFCCFFTLCLCQMYQFFRLFLIPHFQLPFIIPMETSLHRVSLVHALIKGG